ncbi:hypothetical protein B0A58_03385 [Flavobacterium branchiophilum NBRC 15030 = ATCC 35035]|uniref:DUF4190 domain-containing protein n=2 Tax=Flavobacterium branchiophilum TaxID=55197 RepID=G2Z1Z5_FLABF|nr:CCC motif membrane protein [Flavobacterium branchiophilum]OXA79454.1 hypothetical protein B0A58_03385 [Flavobacterium branchiophilum NBRC 15030 = ATCC 35035]PDS24884.1 hypothetical protein B0A77_06390 [Flavobacterium branchiophilum]TQM42416.1 hypothetical protein BC670_3476 [Flavobacterium branchiophilum]CCB69934.1 Hypothetical protein FBFL15_1885 [Flavobacterium branchiophilum FL-15]GEM54623.1 hypothetical protein FB1_08440 [Flavobacterium branchiophilum NBRC 15030 = ATCC 35035]
MDKKQLPNAMLVLVLGILSIITCCCYGIISIILGSVALFMAHKDLALYQANPEAYSNYEKLKLGRILAIIGIVLGVIYMIYLIVLFKNLGVEGVMRLNEEFMRKYQ